MTNGRTLGERLKLLRGKRTQEEVSKLIGLSRARYSHYENNRVEPDTEILKRLADFYNVSIDYLLGRPQSNLPGLTSKDEKDIKKDLEKMINNIENPTDGYAHYDGLTLDDLDEEDRELLIAALETSMRVAKQIAKKKYTPKKHRKED